MAVALQPDTCFVPVVGCQRSGTTLIGQILGAHPDALLVDEDDGAYRLLDAVLAGEDAAAAAAPALDAAAAKYRDGRRGRRPTHLVLKAPNATFAVDALVAACARADLRFVFAVREPRDVVASMARLTSVPMIRNQHRRMSAEPAIAARFADEIALLADPAVPDHRKHAAIWRVKTGLHAAFEAPPLHALRVPYEALVTDADAWRARLFAHAGLPPADVGHDQVMHGTAIGETDRTRAVDAASVGAWRRRLTPAQAADVVAIAAPVMAALGYEA